LFAEEVPVQLPEVLEEEEEGVTTAPLMQLKT
jgi:hypothetical protein